MLLLGLGALAIAGLYFGLQVVQRSLLEKQLDSALRELEQAPPLESTSPLLTHALELATQARSEGTAPLLELAARAFWLAANASEVPADQVRWLRQARDATRDAIIRRPRWPYAWILFARIQFALEPRGTEGPAALSQALQLGLRGFGLQRQLLELRVVSEGRLDPELERAVRASFVLGLRDHGYKLAQLARSLGRTHWACADPEARAKVAAWCDQQRPARAAGR